MGINADIGFGGIVTPYDVIEEYKHKVAELQSVNEELEERLHRLETSYIDCYTLYEVGTKLRVKLHNHVFNRIKNRSISDRIVLWLLDRYVPFWSEATKLSIAATEVVKLDRERHVQCHIVKDC